MREPAQRLDRGVHLDAEHGHQSLVLAVAGQQHDSGPDRFVGRDQRQLLAVADHPSRFRRLAAGQAVEELRLPVAFGAGDPTISPASEREADRPERLPLEAVDHEHLARLAASGAGGGNAASNGRPTMSSTSSASVVASASNVPWFLPSRRTVIRSATSSTSGSRWLTYTTPDATALQPATVRCSASTSSGPRAVVGSSSSSTFGSETSAFATSNSWRSARVREPAGASGNSSRSRSNSASSFLAHRFLFQNARSPVRRRRQEQVVLHGFGQDQRGVLVRHREAQLPGLRRGIPAKGFAPDRDGAQIGVDEPAGDPEEGRLARTRSRPRRREPRRRGSRS